MRGINTSFTPGSMFVVLERTCVKTVARNICHVVMNIGNGKSIDDNTALLNRICIRMVMRSVIAQNEMSGGLLHNSST